MVSELLISCLAGLRVLFIGDSITAALHLQQEERVPELVAKELGIDTVNLGIPCTSSMDWLPWRKSPDLCWIKGGCWGKLVTSKLPADILVIWLGTNDAIGAFEERVTPWPEFFGNIFEMVVAFDGPVLLITPPSRADGWLMVAIYRERIFDLIELHPRIHLGADAWTLLKHPDDFSDAVHPNAEGLAKVAKEVSRSISSFVARSGMCSPERRNLAPAFKR